MKKKNKKKNKTLVLIPARLKSTRFPHKPLIDLYGKSMIRTVFDRCESFGYDTIVLTDSELVSKEIPDDNFIITTEPADNGTDRCMNVIQNLNDSYDRYINVQGDNPDVTKEVIDKVVDKLDCCSVVNAYTDLEDNSKDNKDHVKTIITEDVIHWYTRSPVDYGYKALGFHGYSNNAIEVWKHFKKQVGEEKEGVEQLRWIENHYELNGVYVNYHGIEINTPYDYDLWKNSTLKPEIAPYSKDLLL